MKVLIYRSFANRCDAAVVAPFDRNGILPCRIQNLSELAGMGQKNVRGCRAEGNSQYFSTRTSRYLQNVRHIIGKNIVS
jgi:hypothetical protein